MKKVISKLTPSKQESQSFEYFIKKTIARIKGISISNQFDKFNSKSNMLSKILVGLQFNFEPPSLKCPTHHKLI